MGAEVPITVFAAIGGSSPGQAAGRPDRHRRALGDSLAIANDLHTTNLRLSLLATAGAGRGAPAAQCHQYRPAG